MDLLELLRKRNVDGDVDFLQEALRVLMNTIMDAEVTARIGAECGVRSPDRLTYRNGYRSRQWDIRLGTMELRIPKLRDGSYLTRRFCRWQFAQNVDCHHMFLLDNPEDIAVYINTDTFGRNHSRSLFCFVTTCPTLF